MNNREKTFLKALIFLIIASLPGVLGAASGSQYGRVTYYDDVVTIQKAIETDFQTVDINFPVEAGDRIWTDGTGRIEFQLADRSFVRMDVNSKLDFQAVSDKTDAYGDATILRLWSGAIYIRAEGFDSPEKVFQIDAPSASIYIVEAGLFRIDLYEDGTSGLTVFNGVAEVIGEGGSVLVISGQRTFTSPGSLPMNPEPFNSFERDDFDLWNEARDEAIARLFSSENPSAQEMGLPAEVLPYYDELSYYGFWDYIPSYGYGWCPYGVGAGWRPYYSGFWFWYNWGWGWVGYEPWGWCPYRYGYWDYCGGYGWTWFPGSVWSSAWVTWAVSKDAVGWSPLTYSGSPGGKNALAYGGVRNQGSPLSFSGDDWTFIDRAAITTRDIESVRYSPEKIKELNVEDVTFYAPDAQGRNTAKIFSTPSNAGKMSYSLPEKDFTRPPGISGQDPFLSGSGVKSTAAPAGRSQSSFSPTYHIGTKSSGSAVQGQEKTYTSQKSATGRSGYPSSSQSGRQLKSEKKYSSYPSTYRKSSGTAKSGSYYNPYSSNSRPRSSSSYYNTYTKRSGRTPKSSPYVSGFLNSQRSKSGSSRTPSMSRPSTGKSFSRPSSKGYSSGGSKRSASHIMSGRSPSRSSGAGSAGRAPSGGGGSSSRPSSSGGGKSSGKRR